MTKLLVKLFIKNNEQIKNPAVRQKYGFLSGIIGIISNILLFGGKLFAGIITSSISITADAFNNLSDAGSSIITLIGFKISGLPADKEHPFGHGRLEYVSGLIVSLLIMLMGFELGKSSFEKILNPEETAFSLISIIILSVSVLVKLWLSFFNKKLGKLINSSAMKATATDSLSDVVATSAVIGGIIFTLFTKIQIDGYVGMAVAVFIFIAGIRTAKESLNPLLGQMPDKELVEDIRKTVVSYKEIVGVHDLIIHNYGVGICIVSLHAEVPCTMDFTTAHELIDVIEEDLKITYNCSPTIHMDPVVVDDEETEMLKNKIMEILRAIHPEMSLHDFRKTKGEYSENLIFDVVVPFKFKYSETELTEMIRNNVKNIDEKYFAVINIDKMLS